MPRVSVCPDRQQLERLLLGVLNQQEAAALDGHLLACERCCHVLGELEASDTLAGTLRNVGAGQPALDDRVRNVIRQLKEITLPGKAFEETLARGGEATEDAWELEKLLDTPQAEGELGRFSDYRVLRVLGAGGMGLVFEAEDPRLRRRVALKIVKPGLAARAEHHQRFLREARAAAAIEHPHIVTVYQVGEHRGLPFLAMQLLKGESLDDRLRRQPRLPLDECLRIGRETAEALAEAHGRGLIHRDIKPANIWLEGTSGWVKLVDFGLAHAAEDVHLTQTGAILGTPAYMSPEQARGEAVDGRSDLFSLGAVLYKLTTGDIPFRGANTMAVLMALATETPCLPSQIDPDIPPELDDLIVRLLAKNPDERFQSAQAVAEACGAIEQQGPTREEKGAKPDEGTGRRRPRWQFVAAASAAFLLVAAIVVIVRDRKGNEIARVQVPDDGSLTVSDDKMDKGGLAATAEAAPALREGNAATAAGSPPRSVGTALPEPPPLEEWLKGRELLTVAQDGSGQFKTIQAALDALKPHQVIEVSDAGPYRETLRVDGLPDDVGLISQRRATVELAAWPETPNAGRVVVGHAIDSAAGLRLSGLDFVAPSRDERPGTARMVQLVRCSGLVVEDCSFGWTGERDLGHFAQLLSVTNDGGTGAAPVVVRDCLFDSGGVQWDGSDWPWPGTLVVERNYFKNAGFGLQASQAYEMLFRHNVFSGKGSNLWVHRLTEITGSLEISNNTALLGGYLMFKDAPTGGITLRNNLTERDAVLGEEANMVRAEIAKKWRRDHNAYTLRKYLPKSPTDVTDAPEFLSIDPSARDFARIAEDGALARGGAGGDWPTYIGALPPGPAPKEGDWLTLWIERTK
jgi:hypothetical protein